MHVVSSPPLVAEQCPTLRAYTVVAAAWLGKFVHTRRNELFLKSLLTNTNKAEEEEAKDQSAHIKIGSVEFPLHQIPMAALMDLSLDDLRDLDRKVGLFDCKQKE